MNVLYEVEGFGHGTLIQLHLPLFAVIVVVLMRSNITPYAIFNLSKKNEF